MRWLACLAFACVSCRNAETSPHAVELAGASAGDAAAVLEPSAPLLPPLSSAPTTLERTYAPAKMAPARGANPSLPAALEGYLDAGLGERAAASGWKAATMSTDGKPNHKPGKNRRRLLRFVHLADAQVADDESPARLARYDTAQTTTAAMRPHEGYGCRLLHAAVRTARALHERDPLQLVLLGGDNVDNAQKNEVQWVLQVLGGAPHIECDSGNDDDPVAGPDNDGKDPFASAGVGAPFLWVNGNHDVNVQGNFPVDDNQRATALGTVSNGGTRNYEKPGGPPEVGAFVVADPRRALLSREALMRQLREHDDGHGTRTAKGDRAVYAWDPPGSEVRVVVLDTAHEAGGAAGVLTRRDVDAHVKPLLDAALAEKKIVLLAAHHATHALTREGGTFGRAEPDAMLEAEWLAYLGNYPNVVASFVGHSHRHAIRLLRAGKHALWEITTSALIDYPNQLRLVELFDEDNGWLTLHATAVDVSTDADPVGEEARKRAQVDFAAGWLADGRGAPGQRNAILWVRKP